MKKLTFAILLTLLFLFTACGRVNTPENTPPIQGDTDQTKLPDKDELKASAFFLFEENVHKKYRGDGNEYAEYETYVDYLKNNVMQLRNINPGTQSISVYMLEDGSVKRVFFEGEIDYFLDYTESRNREEFIIKEPIVAGTSWNLEDGSQRSITAVDMDIEVPYGSFQALEITTEGQYHIIKDYYVKGLGHVKNEFISKEDTSFSVTSALELIEKEVPIKQRMTLYFPDFNNERIVYISRSVEVNTNTDILDIFEEELKKVPDNSELTPLLPANASILGIDINREKSIATVDFSPELITDMNAGARLESLIVSSLAYTFGNFFHVDKVVITVEEKPYSSGHIMMEEGEYITVNVEGIQAFGE